MKKTNYLWMIAASTVAGVAAGLITDHRRPERGTVIGGIAGLAAGALAAGLCRQREQDVEEMFNYYSNSSPLYEPDDETSYI